MSTVQLYPQLTRHHLGAPVYENLRRMYPQLSAGLGRSDECGDGVVNIYPENTGGITYLQAAGRIPRPWSPSGGRITLGAPVYDNLARMYPSLRAGLGGLGDDDDSSAICLDQNQNTISCADPNCAYGDCGSTAPQVTAGPLCLDQDENAVACADPNCTYGDCGSGTVAAKHAGTVSTATAATAIPLVARPSPVVSVPLSSQYPGSTSLFLSSATMIPGIPNIALIAGAAVAVALIAGGSGGKRRR